MAQAGTREHSSLLATRMGSEKGHGTEGRKGKWEGKAEGGAGGEGEEEHSLGVHG